MTNIVTPFGFAAVSNFNGAPYSGRTTRVWVPSTDNNAYYIGDAVKSLNNCDATGVSGVVKITNGTDTLRGIISGVEVANVGFPGAVASLQGTDLLLSQVSVPASKTKDYYLYIIDDPDAMFMVQGDSTATNQVASKGNNNCSFTVAAPTPATNALSATVLNSSTFLTTSTLNIRILGLAQIPNNAFGANATWIVKVNQHELMGNQSGV